MAGTAIEGTAILGDWLRIGSMLQDHQWQH